MPILNIVHNGILHIVSRNQSIETVMPFFTFPSADSMKLL